MSPSQNFTRMQGGRKCGKIFPDTLIYKGLYSWFGGFFVILATIWLVNNDIFKPLFFQPREI